MERPPFDTAQWRDIPGYGGAYQISRDGQVRSWRWRADHFRLEPVLLKQYCHRPRCNKRKSFRRYVKLTDPNGRAKEVAVLRLMVEVWFGGYPKGMVAYHKNGNLSDHHYENIGFTSPRKLGQMTDSRAKRKVVAKVDRKGEVVEFYPSPRHAARANHMSCQAVLDRCNGKVKKPFALDGYTYRFD